MNTSSIAIATPIAAPIAAPVPARILPIKVSAKGAISIYGLGRFPVTLYKSQMLSLLANKELIEAFIASNDSTLATKD